MRVARSVTLVVLALSFGGVLAGCDTLENFTIWDTKKKLPGERKAVFPEGVPGVSQGIPQELMKGYQEPQQSGVDPAAAAAQESADKAEPKPKPKPRVVARPQPAPAAQRPQQTQSQQPQQPAPQAQGPWPAQQPQQPVQQAPAPWPGQQQAQQPAWPGAR